jgi:hypothetical protein
LSTVIDLLKECTAAGVELYLDTGRLRYRAQPGAYTEELRQGVAVHRDAVVAELASRPVTLDLTREDCCQEALLPEAKARRFKVTLTSGKVLLHSAPSGLTRREAIELSKEWGEVAECVPIACEEGPSGKDVMATPVPLDLTLAAATAGLPITAEQFRSFLSQEDLADIAAGLIPGACLRAYAERFSKCTETPQPGARR